MLILRPIETLDLDDLFVLAEQLDSMNLPRDHEFLKERIALSLRSFSRQNDADESPIFVFALIDREVEKVIGTSMIMAKTGGPGDPY